MTRMSPAQISMDLVPSCQNLHLSPNGHWPPCLQGRCLAGDMSSLNVRRSSCMGVSMAPGLPRTSLSVTIRSVLFAMSDGVLHVSVPSLSLSVSEAFRLALQHTWWISGTRQRTL